MLHMLTFCWINILYLRHPMADAIVVLPNILTDDAR